MGQQRKRRLINANVNVDSLQASVISFWGGGVEKNRRRYKWFAMNLAALQTHQLPPGKKVLLKSSCVCLSQHKVSVLWESCLTGPDIFS